MLYSQYGTGYDAVVEADTSYSGIEGCMRMVQESVENEHNVFNVLIANDFAEAYDKANGYYTESSSYITEGFLGNLWAKVVDFFKKVWAKIKGIIDSLITNIKMKFTKDGKELWNKYNKVVQQKLSRGELSTMKYKFCEENKPVVLLGDAVDSLAIPALANLTTAVEISNDAELGTGETYNADEITKAREELAKKKDSKLRPYTEDEKTDMKEKAFGIAVGRSGSKISQSELQQEMDEHFYKDEDEFEGLKDSHLDDIRETLTLMDKTIRELEKNKREIDKAMKDLIKKAEDVRKKMDDLQSSQKAAVASVAAQGCASRAITCASIAQSVSGSIVSAITSTAKKHAAQCRAVFIKAYNFKKKKGVDESALEMAIEEASNYEVDCMFDGSFTESIFG